MKPFSNLLVTKKAKVADCRLVPHHAHATLDGKSLFKIRKRSVNNADFRAEKLKKKADEA